MSRIPPVTVALAPMSGVTDVAFRRIAARCGADLVVTEMVAAGPLLRREAEARLRSESAGIGPHVVQLVGRDPTTLAEAARLAEGAGADIVDVNFGCPARSVTGGLAGSSLMREPSLALRLMVAVVEAVRIPVTVKMRLGWDRQSLNAAELASAGEGAGIAGFAVHGRTRQDFYKGRADWAAIREVVSAVRVPVIANGDIASAEEARQCLAASGAAGVMVGRAALGQPWLVGAIGAELAGRPRLPPDLSTRAALAVEHYEGLLLAFGRAVGTRHARKHLAAFADRAAEAGFGLPSTERRELVTATDPRQVRALLSRIYDAPTRLAA